MKIFVLLMILFIPISLVDADLGEFAGPLRFSLLPGQSETLNMTIFNTDLNTSLAYYIQFPPTNGSYAIGTKYANGTLGPNATKTLPITVKLSENASGTFWSGIIGVVAQINESLGGERIRPVIGKQFTISLLESTSTTAVAPTTTVVPVSSPPASAQDSFPLYLLGGIGIVSTGGLLIWHRNRKKLRFANDDKVIENEKQ